MYSVLLLALCSTAFANLVTRDLNTDPGVKTILTRSAGNSPTCTVSSQTQSAHKDQFLAAHNGYRKNEGATNMHDVVWDEDLAKVTQELVNKCKWAHDLTKDCNGHHAGQNLYLSWTSASSINVNPQAAVKSWFDEKKDYTYSNNSCNAGAVCGHYTQVVWGHSQRVGCSYKECPSVEGLNWGPGTYLLVACNYSPGGNYVGQKPYKTGGNACSGCAPGQTCVNSMCHG